MKIEKRRRNFSSFLSLSAAAGAECERIINLSCGVVGPHLIDLGGEAIGAEAIGAVAAIRYPSDFGARPPQDLTARNDPWVKLKAAREASAWSEQSSSQSRLRRAE